MLYVILHRRGHFRIEGWLASRIARQLVAGARDGAALYGIRMRRSATGSPARSVERLVGVGALVGGGMAVYFPLVWLIGGIDKDELQRRCAARKKAVADAG